MDVNANQTSSELAPNELPGLPPGAEAVIALRGVAKWYGDVVAVSDLTFGIGAGVTGLLVPPRDPVALRAALERLLEDPELRRRLGEAGREKAHAELSWEAATATTIAVYRDALARAR